MKNLIQSAAKSIEQFQESEAVNFIEVPGIVAPTSVGIQPLSSGDYGIYLRLRVDGFTLKKGRTTNANREWGNFFSMPWVKKNCFADCGTCFDNGNYQLILITGCQGASFQLELHFEKDDDSDVFGRTIHDIHPDCSIPGQVECVE